MIGTLVNTGTILCGSLIGGLLKKGIKDDYREALCAAGLTLSGLSPDGRLVEAAELSDRAFFVGVQYHPEFKSRPDKAHPLFRGFVEAALEGQQR